MLKFYLGKEAMCDQLLLRAVIFSNNPICANYTYLNYFSIYINDREIHFTIMLQSIEMVQIYFNAYLSIYIKSLQIKTFLNINS